MSWRDQLRPASFRGAAFFVDSLDLAVGRRLARHDFAGRNQGFAEDLGRRMREHSVEAFVIGPDYMAARDALIAACETAGPGTLVHPTLGTRRVSVEALRLRESSRQGGMVRITLTVVEAGAARFPEARADTAARVSAAADAAASAAQAAFEEGFTTVATPAFVAAAAAERVDLVRQALDTAARRIAPAGALGRGLRQALDGLAAALAPVRDAAALAAAIGDGFGLLATLGGAAGDVRRILSEFSGFAIDWPAIAALTPSRARQAANQAAVAGLGRRLGLVEAARAAAAESFDSYRAAEKARRDLAGRLDVAMDEAAAAGDDRAFAALRELRVAAVGDLTARAADLARVFTYTLAAPQPAVVVSQRLYQDIAGADDLVARNHIRHPGFVPAGRALEVLTAGGMAS